MDKELDLGRGIYCWLEGDARDLVIDDKNHHILVVLDRQQFKRLCDFYKANACGEE